jgi:2',3'-cyclic-nucleotide 2'-phosphodiesterase (5'-nucleotidase family)
MLAVLCASFASSPAFLPAFGKINILITTDVHSWVAGHSHPCGEYCSPQIDRGLPLDADFGRLVDLYTHLRESAAQQGKDLFLMDNGDAVDGTGLSGGYPHGAGVFKQLKKMPYDALNIGNHELYKSETIEALKTDMIPHWNGSYLTSNVMDASSGDPLGHQMVELRGKFGSKVLVFGFMYNMEDHTDVVTIQDAHTVVKQQWFVNAVNSTDADALVVLAHMDLKDPLVRVILNGIRFIKPHIPVQFLTGHSHTRGSELIDSYTFNLEAGCYADTAGMITIDIDPHSASKKPTFGHYFIDMNIAELIEVTNTSSASFETNAGKSVSASIGAAREALGLSEVLGLVPRNYSGHAGLDESDSLWALYLNEVLPTQLFVPARNKSQWFVASTGAIRYNLFEGNVTADDLWAIAPFEDKVNVVRSVPAAVASALVATLNKNEECFFKERLQDGWGLRNSAGNSRLPNYVSTALADGPTTFDVLFADFDTNTIVSAITKLQNGTKLPVERLNNISDTTLWIHWARTLR